MKYLGLKDGETTSYENAQMCQIIIPTCIGLFSLMEIASYFLYLNKVMILPKMFDYCYCQYFKVSSVDQDCPGPGGRTGCQGGGGGRDQSMTWETIFDTMTE